MVTFSGTVHRFTGATRGARASGPRHNYMEGCAFPGGWNDEYSWTTQLGIIDLSPDIPTVSEWGLVAMALLVLSAGTVVLARRRRVLRIAG